MCLQVRYKKNMKKKVFFFILKVIEERSWIRIHYSEVRIRIRIHTKMSRIPSTGLYVCGWSCPPWMRLVLTKNIHFCGNNLAKKANIFGENFYTYIYSQNFREESVDFLKLNCTVFVLILYGMAAFWVIWNFSNFKLCVVHVGRVCVFRLGVKIFFLLFLKKSTGQIYYISLLRKKFSSTTSSRNHFKYVPAICILIGNIRDSLFIWL